jgi:drug/metabolite transporter (DMT)-like permease
MAVLWGSTFFSIKALLGQIGAADLLAVRFSLSTIVLILVFRRVWPMERRLFLRGAALGGFYATAQLLQTVGLGHTSASVSGFLTGLYVVLTPVVGFALFRQRLHRMVWLAVGLALAGLAGLAIHPGEGPLIGYGDLLTIGSALFYAIHIVFLGRWSKPSDAGALTVVQAITMTLVFIVAALPGGIGWPQTTSAWLWIVYLAIPCGAVALLAQTWAQGYVPPTKASVIMCSEPLWATVFAIAFGGERLTGQFVLGAVAVLAAMYVVIKGPPPDDTLARSGRPGTSDDEVS